MTDDYVLRTHGLSKSFLLNKHFPDGRIFQAAKTFIRNATSRRSIDKSKQLFWAVRDVSFDAQAGDILAIIGRNGAGKSTLLKMLARVYQPNGGYADVRGRLSALLEVGVGFHPELTGRENIFLNGAILGMKRAEIAKKFDEIISFAEVEDFIDTPLKRYSSGMCLRLGFGVASCLDPDVLIVDEALAVGDAAFQKKCTDKIREFQQSGKTILFVSHNVGMVTNLCNKAIYLSDGTIRSMGPTQQIMTQYLEDIAGAENDTVDLDRARKIKYKGMPTKFKTIQIKDGERSLMFGSKLSFDLEIESQVEESGLKESGLTIGCSFMAADGVVAATLLSRDSFDIGPGETLKFSLTVDDLVLAPGTYHCIFSLGKGGLTTVRRELDQVWGTPNFEILPICLDGSGLAEWPGDYSHVMSMGYRLELVQRNEKQTADPVRLMQ